MDKSDVLLIVAVSARALAQSVRRARLTPIAIDAFGDEDARAACKRLTVAPDCARSFAGADMDSMVLPLVQVFRPRGIVYGSGFDDCPDQLRRLCEFAPLLGASPDAFTTAKDPNRFAELCALAGLLHPEISASCPLQPSEWLLKRAGGCGGIHIRDGQGHFTQGDYWQRRVKGNAISLLFTRDERYLTPLAWSEQWTAPDPSAPYRYGGAAGPITHRQAPETLPGLTELTQRLGLRGLASADFLDDGENLWLLEINPRPGATLDVFDADDDPLILRHLSALAGRDAAAPAHKSARAAGISYAESDLIAPSDRWPDWAADRPATGARIPKGSPFCTVRAGGETVTGAKALLFERMRQIQDFAEGAAA